MPMGGGIFSFAKYKNRYLTNIVLSLKMTTRSGNYFSEFGRPSSNSSKAGGMINTYTIIVIQV
jgi:hypothetical protein